MLQKMQGVLNLRMLGEAEQRYLFDGFNLSDTLELESKQELLLDSLRWSMAVVQIFF